MAGKWWGGKRGNGRGFVAVNEHVVDHGRLDTWLHQFTALEMKPEEKLELVMYLTSWDTSLVLLRMLGMCGLFVAGCLRADHHISPLEIPVREHGSSIVERRIRSRWSEISKALSVTAARTILVGVLDQSHSCADWACAGPQKLMLAHDLLCSFPGQCCSLSQCSYTADLRLRSAFRKVLLNWLLSNLISEYFFWYLKLVVQYAIALIFVQHAITYE